MHACIAWKPLIERRDGEIRWKLMILASLPACPKILYQPEGESEQAVNHTLVS
jgi:hypothetical protein